MITDHMGETPLHLAAMNGFLGCVQLLSNPEVVDVVSMEGNSALHLATVNSNKRIVAFLLTQNADADLQNKKKETPRSIAGARKDKQLLDYFDPEKLRLLEEIEKTRDTNEELLQQVADLKNTSAAEVRKRESAYTVIKVSEDKIAELASEVERLTRENTQSRRAVAEKDETIEALRRALQDAEIRANSLQSEVVAAQASSVSGATSVKEFPSELIYSKVREAQTELQRLSNMLEQSQSAILTTKTAINLLEETLQN